MVIKGVIVGSAASHADEAPQERSDALIYAVQTESNEAAVAKIPSNCSRYAREVRWRLQDDLLLPLQKGD